MSLPSEIVRGVRDNNAHCEFVNQFFTLPSTASDCDVAVPTMSALTEASLRDTNYYPGMEIKATTADINNFTGSMKRQGVLVTYNHVQKTQFTPKTKAVNLNFKEGSLNLSQLTDEFAHAWNQVWGRGRFLEASEAGLHRGLGAEAEAIGSNGLGRNRNTVFHKLELRNFLQSGQHIPEFMWRIGKEHLREWSNSHKFHY